MVTLIMPLAGRGSRFGEAYSLPKPLLDVDGLPMVVKATQCLPHCGRKIFITQQEHINKYHADLRIRQHFAEAEILGINGVTDGQATTCEMGIRHFGIDPEDAILISACDHGQIYDRSAWEKIEADESIDVSVWTFTGHPTTKTNPKAWGWLSTAHGCVTDVHCKYLPKDMDPVRTPVITGTMFFRKARYFLDGLEMNRRLNFRTNGEFYVDNVLNRCIDQLNVQTFEIGEYICWGLPEDYEQNKSRGA